MKGVCFKSPVKAAVVRKVLMNRWIDGIVESVEESESTLYLLCVSQSVLINCNYAIQFVFFLLLGFGLFKLSDGWFSENLFILHLLGD